ncbi:esterase E4 [Nilaparvata lugens]|uniref:esterase E4 n=1 Tax=Nilaparvata lugens TaxID=108931 RepID=UPI00193CC5B9|nr:esterase E4 [Nilaparvata lugens]
MLVSFRKSVEVLIANLGGLRWTSQTRKMQTTNEIKLSIGSLVGCKKVSVYDGKEYFSFQGIPFAEPPLGKLRFKDPLPIKPWQGVKQCTKPGNPCFQIHEFSNQLIGSEDCLFLNVYTPKIFGPNELKPVMVWIHGGGFTCGSGDDELYAPDFFVHKDVVLVCINYRVGVLGFLSLGNSDVPGNAGLKDQVLALKWVQENIGHFGGDANNVTIFGESAGAASCHILSMSNMARGLFHKVIMQSGSALNPWGYVENTIPRAFLLGELLGKKTSDADELISFLRDQTKEDLIVSQSKVLCQRELRQLFYPFVPCKEVAGTGTNLLTESPERLLKSGQFAQVPYIIGMTSKEGIISLKEPKLLSKLEKINGDVDRFVPHELNVPGIAEHVFPQVKHFYFGNHPVSRETLDQYIDLYSDLCVTIGLNKSLKYICNKGLKDVYVYQFTFEGELGFFKRYIKTVVPEAPPGVSHADDLGYIFHSNFVNGREFPLAPNCPERKIVDTFITLWTNFAANGNPNGSSIQVDWKPNDPHEFKYLNIGEELAMVNSKLMKERDDFWEKIYSKYSPAPKL